MEVLKDFDQSVINRDILVTILKMIESYVFLLGNLWHSNELSK